MREAKSGYKFLFWILLLTLLSPSLQSEFLLAEEQQSVAELRTHEFSLDDLLSRLYDRTRFTADQGESLWVDRFRGKNLEILGAVEYFERGSIYISFGTSSGFYVSAMVLLSSELPNEAYWKLEKGQAKALVGTIEEKPFSEPCPWYEGGSEIAIDHADKELEVYLQEVLEEAFGPTVEEKPREKPDFFQPPVRRGDDQEDKGDYCLVLEGGKLQ